MEMEFSEWLREMGKGQWVKGMESALWVMQGMPGRGGKLAVASRRERFRFCCCSRSFCLS